LLKGDEASEDHGEELSVTAAKAIDEDDEDSRIEEV
jgi:hypothetical protein